MNLYKAYVINGEILSYEYINKNTYDGLYHTTKWYISNCGFDIREKPTKTIIYIDFDYPFVSFNPATLSIIYYKKNILDLEKIKNRDKNIDKLL